MTRIRILVVDDHPIVRSGLTSVLSSQADFDVVGEASNGDEAVAASARLLPSWETRCKRERVDPVAGKATAVTGQS